MKSTGILYYRKNDKEKYKKAFDVELVPYNNKDGIMLFEIKEKVDFKEYESLNKSLREGYVDFILLQYNKNFKEYGAYKFESCFNIISMVHNIFNSDTVLELSVKPRELPKFLGSSVSVEGIMAMCR